MAAFDRHDFKATTSYFIDAAFAVMLVVLVIVVVVVVVVGVVVLVEVSFILHDTSNRRMDSLVQWSTPLTVAPSIFV